MTTTDGGAEHTAPARRGHNHGGTRLAPRILAAACVSLLLSFCLVRMLSASAASEAPPPQVGAIDFEQDGSAKVPEQLLLYNLWLRKGRPFTQEKLDEDVKRLVETGYFTDVSAHAKDAKDGAVDIVFKVKCNPRVHKITVTGNEKFKEDITEKLAIQEQEALSDKSLQKTIQDIRNFYTEKGYYEAKVTPQLTHLPDGEVDIAIKIDENLRLKVHNVNFEGNTVYSSGKLADEIETQHSWLSWLFDWGLFNVDELERDKLRLRNLYWEKGYLDFSADTEVKKLDDDPEYVDVLFKITQGEPYTVRSATIDGNTVFPPDELDSLLSLKPGETYNYKTQKADVKALENKYYPKGYCDMASKPKLDPDFQTHQVAVVYNIHEGKPFTIQDIQITGNRITKDYVIRRELPIQPGAPVDPSLIDVGKSRLMAMNYFKSVDTFTAAGDEESTKDVTYQVEEKGTARVSIGGGWSSSDSLMARLQVSESNFDITDPKNFFRGGGQRVDMLAQVGLERMDFGLNFSEPWLFGIPLRLDTSGFFNTRTYEYWKERHVGFDIGLTKPFWEFNSIGLNYVMDFVNVSSMSDKYSEDFRKKAEGNFRRAGLGLTLKRDTRDNIMDPTQGYLLSLGNEFNTNALGGSNSYYKFDGKASGYWNFFDKMFVAHLGGKIGTQGGIFGSEVPFYDKYFLGGQNSIRGFQYRMVSPLNENRVPLGGQSMISGTAEVSHPIYKWIRGAPFVDFGNAWADTFDYKFNMNVGAGYGLRIKVPQITSAPIRLDLGVPIYRADSGLSSNIQFYFDVGFDY